MEPIIKIVIYIHAFFGGVALISGLVAIVVKKGGKLHKKSGKLFYTAMLTSVIISLLVALLPRHENPFLFSIGIFSAYLLISGYRSLRYKRKNINLKTDKWMAILIIITGFLMVVCPVVFQGNIHIILFVFGIISIVFGSRDLVLFRSRDRLKKAWLKLHVGRMTGGYIASVTAFFVVNQFLPGIYNWFAPSILGSFFIAFWMWKLSTENLKKAK